MVTLLLKNHWMIGDCSIQNGTNILYAAVGMSFVRNRSIGATVHIVNACLQVLNAFVAMKWIAL